VGSAGIGGWEPLAFPPDSRDRKVSPEARDFLRRALALNVDDRPDVAAICCDAYLRKVFTARA